LWLCIRAQSYATRGQTRSLGWSSSEIAPYERGVDGKNVHAMEALEVEQVCITGDDEIGAAGERAREHGMIVGIGITVGVISAGTTTSTRSR
jgi:hypothetical protein